MYSFVDLITLNKQCLSVYLKHCVSSQMFIYFGIQFCLFIAVLNF